VNEAAPATTTPASVPRESVTVWDWPVRAVHWAMVVLLVALVTTGKLGDDWLPWHMRFGQTLLALVLFRILWGFVGSPNARFSAFVRGPAAVASYLRSRLARDPEIHVSHNPIGGWMVILLLVAMLAQACAGLFTNDEILWEGPLAGHVTQAMSNAFSSIHRRLWWVVVGLAAVHIAAVVVYLVVLRENLIVPMVDGRKALPIGAARAEDGSASTARALVLLVASFAAVFGLLALA
jgi:cytochrome b